LAWPEEGKGPGMIRLLLANLGDSRGLLLRPSSETSGDSSAKLSLEVVGETSDHSPDAPEEKRRILEAGGTVEKYPGSRCSVLRIDGSLGCSRALGDFRFKEDAALLPHRQKVSTVPDVYEFGCERGDVVVLGCDGVFDVLTSIQVAAIVSQVLETSPRNPGAAASAVVEAALHDPRQQDNV
ncbi:unnamed protein product, partial [Polarella glacialis]